MSLLDTLIYDPERLACSNEEKEMCLETVRKLARLYRFFRRNGLLAADALAEEESDPFFRTCLFEFGEAVGEDSAAARFERASCAYLTAGNYRGGAFLNAVLIIASRFRHFPLRLGKAAVRRAAGILRRGVPGARHRRHCGGEENAEHKSAFPHSRV